MRSVNKKVIAIALAGRRKGAEGEERRIQRYREFVSLTRKILNQAKDVLEEISSRRQARLKPLREILETMSERVQKVICQTKARVLSVFEAHTRPTSRTNLASWCSCRELTAECSTIELPGNRTGSKKHFTCTWLG